MDSSKKNKAQLLAELESLKKQTMQQDKLLSNLNIIILEGDADSVTYVGGKSEEILGYTIEEWYSDPDGAMGFWYKHLHPDDREVSAKHCMNAINECKDHVLEYRMIAADGRVVWFHDTVDVEINNDGGIFVRAVMVDITERKKAEESLIKSEHLYHTTIDAMSDAIHVMDLDYRIVLHNKKLEDWNALLDISDEIDGNYLFDLYPFLPQEIKLEYKEAISDKKIVINEETISINNEMFVTETVKIPVIDQEKVIRVITIVRDITSRKKSELALMESEEKYRTVVENVSDIVYSYDVNGLITFISPNVEKLTGYNSNEIIGHSFMEFIHPDDKEKIAEDFEKTITREEEFPTLFRLLTKDGRYIYLEEYGKIMKEGEALIGVSGVLRDITERMQAEEVLQFTKFSVENALDQIFWLNSEGQFIEVNESAHLSLGYTKAELLSKSIMDIIVGNPEEYESQIWPKRWEIIKQKKRVRFESEHKKKDGEIIQVEIAAHYMSFQDEEFMCAFARDITERKQSEEMQLNEMHRLESVINSIPDATVIVNENREIQICNPAFTTIFGYKQEEVFGKSTAVFYAEKESYFEKGQERFNIEADVKSDRFINYYKRKNGEIFPAETAGVPFEDKQGNTIGFVGIMRDMSIEFEQKAEKEKLENQLFQAQKMESIGILAGGIAHDFNNLLTAIMGNAELAMMAIPSGEQAYQDVQEIKNNADRAANLTRQLLTFSRRQVVEPRVLNINEILLNTNKMLHRLIGENIELVTLPAEGLWYVKIDPSQLEQVLINLALNARDALPDGGKLTIETMNTILPKDDIQEPIEVSGDYVLIKVQDTGVGMDEEALFHAFEPFYTTKEIGKGTGLGLSTCYGIVKQNNGYISLVSTLEFGTTVSLYFPKSEDQTEHAFASPDQTEIPRGTERVLVVEDEESICRMIVSILKKYGYTVLDASNGEEALRMIENQETCFDILVTDLMMPRMGGKELSKAVRSKFTDMKILFMSGYTNMSIVRDVVNEKGLAFIQKPFSPTEIVQKIRQMLDE